MKTRLNVHAKARWRRAISSSCVLPRHLLWLLAVAVLMLADSADAKVGPPVEVQLLGEPTAAVANTVYTGEIVIRSGASAEVSDFRILGAGWQPIRLGVPATVSVAAGDELRVPFEARPADPDQPLIFQFSWNGQTITRRLDLSPARVQRVSQPGRASPVPEYMVEPFRGVDRSMPSPQPAERPAEEAARDRLEDNGTKGDRDRNIHIWGRFVYLREDNVVIGGDGITVEILDNDGLINQELGRTITDPFGYFDITVVWDQLESDPDIIVRFEAVNTEFDVRDDTWFITYKWDTEEEHNFSGTSLDLGWVWPEDDSEHGAVQIMTDLVRSWRWYVNRGYDCTEVDVFWPADDRDVSYYTPSPWRNIHFTTAATWWEDTHSHEYTHHFIDDFAEREDPDYCNPGDFCDEPGDCGHCVFCQENTYVTWSEGIAHYGGHTIPDSYASSYGQAARFVTLVDTLRNCHEDGNLHSPTLTEGFFGAILVDIDDSDTGDNHAEYPSYEDILAMGGEEILTCIDIHHPMSAMEFLLAFKAENYSVREALWETGMNCGYDIDEAPPGVVTDLHPDGNHPIGDPSPDNTITVHWDRADDDASGVSNYSIAWSHLPEDPGYWNDIGNVYTAISDPLAPGTWYFSIRAKDRAGNWSPDWVSCGPMIIREPENADLALFHHTGWDYTLVPSTSTTNDLWDCTVSPTLPGDVAGTYWNVTGYNIGESTTSTWVIGQVGYDEQVLDADNYGTLDQWESFYTLNEGPITVPAGRHVFHFVVDPNENIPETNESNNDWGHQFVWIPPELTQNDVQTRQSPAFIFAGHDYVHDGSPLYVNVDGLRFPGLGWWNMVVSWPADNDEFYPIALFYPATGAENGFQTSLATSFRPYGCLTAVIVNQNEVTNDLWDVGVTNWSPSFDQGYKAVFLANGSAFFDMDLTHSFGEDQFFTLKEFYASPDEVGAVSLMVQTDPPFTPLCVQWRDEWFTYGDLLDCTAETVTDADGWAHLQIDITENGYNSIVFWRDPKDGRAPLDIHYRLEMTKPDLTPYWAAGWHSPAVPRPAADGTMFSVPLPDTLHGDVASTYHNYALINNSPGDSPNLVVHLKVDDQLDVAFSYTAFPAYATSRYNWSTPRTFRGGRHTYALIIDPAELVEEIREDNNIYGEQYCWSPYELVANDVRLFVGAPPRRMAGWDQVTSGEPLWFNCDGYRLLNPGTWWTGCAIMCADTSNMNVRLHEPLVGAKDGFTTNLVSSGWGIGQSDYVLVNHNLVPRDEVDAGVLGISGDQTYSIQYATETYLGGNPDGIYGPYDLNAARILNLHEMWLPTGTWYIDLEHLSGNVDWGVCLHPHDVPYVSKINAMEGGIAWLNVSGEDEYIQVEVTEVGYYALAVWKVHAYDLMQSGTYRLSITNVVTGVDSADEVPAVTALTSVYPNPFNPRTTIAYDLAVPGEVEVVIYDLQGARVRTLVHAVQPAGHHSEVWDGRSDRGEMMAAGVYIARFVSGDVKQMQKLTLVK